VPGWLESIRETSDEALLAACLRGDQVAWNELIDRYAALIYSIPLKYGLGEPDAADVFQSVCITLLEKLGSIRAPRGLAAWIITTTSRQCLAVARQRRRDQQHSIPAGLAADDLGPIDPDLLPDEELLVLEREHVVRHAVERLPETCRRLINALFSDEPQPSSYQRLADGLGVPMNSLGPTRARCLEKLRRLLVAAGYVP
jgi:RNA polymerase sigma factor (sigma-70 family)